MKHTNTSPRPQSPAWHDWKAQALRVLTELRRERGSDGSQAAQTPRGDMQRALA